MYYGFCGAFYLIALFWRWISNGFNFRKTREELRFLSEMAQEENERMKLETQRLQEEWERKRQERLGW